MIALFLLISIGIFCGSLSPSSSLTKTWLSDGFIALGCGIAYACLATDWFSLFYLENSSVIYADFVEYCNGVSAPRPLEAGVSNKRSALPMLLSRKFYNEHGVFDALAWGAIIAQIGMGSLFYLWGRITHSRTFGILIVLLAFVPAPMNFTGRILSSYPAMSLCFMAGAVLSLWGMASRRSFLMLSTGIGIALILLADTRGLVWALPLFCTAVFISVFRGRWWQKILRLGLLFLPLYYSFQLADQFYVFDAIGIEAQVDIRPSLYHWVKIYPPPWVYPSNFTWGMAPLSDLPKALFFLWEQALLDVPEELVSFEVERGRYIAQYHLNFAGAGLLFGLYQHRKDPWKALAILASVSPFLLTFHGALGMLEEHPRFYIQTLPGIIICWGFVCQGLLSLAAKWPILRPRWIKKGTSPLLLILMTVLVFGILPSFLSPTADWRRGWQGRPDDFRQLVSRFEDGSMKDESKHNHCFKALIKNEREKRPQRATLYQTTVQQSLLEFWAPEESTE